MTTQNTNATPIVRRIWTIAGAVIGLIALAPLAVIASHQFNDVPDSNIFHDDIAWMADNGITLGCGGGNYCPSDNVTREQMAAFMQRLATSNVVDANTANNASQLDGLDSSDFALADVGELSPIARFNVVSGFGVDDAEFRAPVTGAPTGSWDGTRWVVDVPGQTVNLNTRQAICSAVGSTPFVVGVGSLGGDLLVYVSDLAGTPTQSSVQCTLYAEVP